MRRYRVNCYNMHIFIVLFTVKWKDRDILTCTEHTIDRLSYPRTAKPGKCIPANIWALQKSEYFQSCHVSGLYTYLRNVPILLSGLKYPENVPSSPRQPLTSTHYRPGETLRATQSAHEGGKVVSPTRRPSATRNPRYSFLLEAGRFKSTKNSTDPIGNWSCGLPACSAVSRSNAPPRTPNQNTTRCRNPENHRRCHFQMQLFINSPAQQRRTLLGRDINKGPPHLKSLTCLGDLDPLLHWGGFQFLVSAAAGGDNCLGTRW